jgi:kumamolisin
VPDVAGNADRLTGFMVRVDGKWRHMGGTSAVAPLYAGLVALLNQSLGRPLGALAPTLYGIRAGSAGAVFRGITSGDNSVPAGADGDAVPGYRAAPGWNACTGLGSIDGSALLSLLSASPTPSLRRSE